MGIESPHFVVDFVQPEEKLSEEIMARIFLSRIHNQKNTIILITGRSGEGKSRLALRIAEICARKENWDLHKYLDTVLMFTPVEYQRSMKKILYDPNYKEVNIAWLDEARVLVDKSKWQTFVNQSIAHVNAMVRGLKRIIFIIVTQSPKDIDASIRRTADFWIQCTRPQHKSTYARVYYFYENMYDIENIKLKYGKVRGLIRMPDGKRIAIKPKHFVVRMPSPELDLAYSKLHDERKGRVLQAKIDELAKSFEKNDSSTFTRIDSLIEWVLEKPERQVELLKKYRGKLRLLPNARTNFDLTDSELQYFDKKMNEKIGELNKKQAMELIINEPSEGA